MERRWAFAAALSWFILAVIALIPAILGVVTIVALPYGVIIGLLGVVIPFFIGRGIIGKSAVAGVSGALYALGLLIYLVALLNGPFGGAVVLLWLAFASGAAAIELHTSEVIAHCPPHRFGPDGSITVTTFCLDCGSFRDE